jgi:RNA-binding protein
MNDATANEGTGRPAAAPVLDAAARQALKARAHPLKPVVMIGEAGLTPQVLAEIERALVSHELIKIRVFGDDRTVRAALLAEICGLTGSAPVQQIGKLLVVWRPAPAPQPEAGGQRDPRAPHHRKKAAGAGQAAPSRRGRSARPAGSGAAKRPAAPAAKRSSAAAAKRASAAGAKRSPGAAASRFAATGPRRASAEGASGGKRTAAPGAKRPAGAGSRRSAETGSPRDGAPAGRRASTPGGGRGAGPAGSRSARAGASAGPAPRPRTKRTGGR